MARLYATKWNRYRFLLSGLLLVLPVLFFYQSMNPGFPPLLPEKEIGSYKVAPMPFDLEQSYQHDGVYVKDFLFFFSSGDLAGIRQAFVNIGDKALPLKIIEQGKGEEGILHGSPYGKHVHALATPSIEKGHKLWLTIEQWDGSVLKTSWGVTGILH